MLINLYVNDSMGLFLKIKIIDHINDIKTDNRLENLQLVTQKENCKNQRKIEITNLLPIIIIENILKQ